MAGLSRRGFLARSGVLAGGLVVGSGAACSSGGDGGGDADEQGDDGDAGRDDQGSSTSLPFDPGDWASVRDQFPLTPDLRHFAAFVLAAHPAPVAAAIERHRRGLDEDTNGYLAATEADAESAVRTAAGEYLDAPPGDIALTDSTTMGLGLVYGGLRLGPGQEVVTTEHDFYSTHEALRLQAERTGATVRRVRLYDDPADASVDGLVGPLVEAVTPATRALAVTWVHSGTGVKLPVAAIAEALRDVNDDRDEDDRVLLCVDGIHGLGVEDVTVADLGCDFLISGTHKWLFGPRGTGIVWGRPEAWAAVAAAIPPFSPDSFTGWVTGTPATGEPPGLRTSPGGYHSFEHRWAATEAFAFHQAIGKQAVAERTHDQATRLKEGLADVPGVELVTPMSAELSSGIVCVAPEAAPEEVLGALQAEGIVASLTPYAHSYVRFGPSIVTTPDEVDAVVEALRA